MNIDFIISPLLGAFIAGMSNRMAIRLLFSPAEPKYIFGIRIPFTPGVIPKERKRIAASIGETAGNYILNEEGIIEAFTSQDISERIKEFAGEILKSLKQNDLTVEEFLHDTFGDDAGILIQKIRDIPVKFLSEGLSERKWETAVLDIFNQWFDNTVSLKLERLIGTEGVSDSGLSGISKWLSKCLGNLVQQEYFLENIRKIVLNTLDDVSKNSRPVSDYLTASEQAALNEFILSHSEGICKFLLKYVNNRTVQAKINRYVESSVSSSVIGKLILRFVNKDRIYAHIYSEINKFLSSKRGRREVSNVLLQLLEKVYSSTVSDLLESIGYDNLKPHLERFADYLIRKLATEENLKFIALRIGQWLREKSSLSIKEFLIEVAGTESPVRIKLMIQGLILELIRNERLLPLADSLMTAITGQLMTMKVSHLISLDDEDIERLQELACQKAKDIVIANAKSILQFVDIKKITTDRINSLDIADMEKLILNVVNKDLWALTFLEAFIGFCIGFLSPLLSQLFKAIFY